jgi:hypothetical protein
MFNAGVCASMSIGTPRASLRALIEVRAILTEVGFHDSRTAVERRGEEKVDAKASTKRGDRKLAARAATERGSDHETRRKKPSVTGHPNPRLAVQQCDVPRFARG